MDSKVFKYVVALAETGSYSRAAKELYITPQGLANSVKRLEASIGVPLFKADREGTALTQYGRVVCEFAKTYELEFSQMMDEIDRIKKMESKTISLSVSTGLFNDLSREDILGFNECSKTGAKVVLGRTQPDHFCEEALLNKACDFAFLNNPVKNAAFLSVPLHKDMQFLWTPEDSPLAAKNEVECIDFAGADLVCLEQSEYVSTEEYADKLREPPYSCNLYFVDEMIEVIEISMRRRAYGIVPRPHVMAFSGNGYVGVPIRDLTRGFSVAYRRDRELSPWDEEFLAYLSSRSMFYC
ncbi:LysR family transcriptional regulator [uncultured Slackia sp.]|uniref:LysR family transcriptional regulator n=1 Tax=uncultured Slackia sp. TaxID=665903 RepID=UPI0025EB4178|nr:LysR family transcriptional regulator [uncultured Slackia sp.]